MQGMDMGQQMQGMNLGQQMQGMDMGQQMHGINMGGNNGLLSQLASNIGTSNILV
jgi:hypothetical protein